MKARIYHAVSSQPNYVTVEEDNPQATWDDDAPARILTTYFCPSSGGYVRIHDVDRRYPQVCDGLSSLGSTLYCHNPDRLIDLIRRERRKGIEQDRRAMERM